MQIGFTSRHYLCAMENDQKQERELKLSPITIFVGPNGSGKSRMVEHILTMPKRLEALYGIKKTHVLQEHHLSNTDTFTKEAGGNLWEILHSYYIYVDNGDNSLHGYIQNWLQTFGIANDFRVIKNPDDSFSVEVQSSEFFWMHLVDMGSGTILMIKMLMELAWLSAADSESTLVIVESPENILYPKNQSLLADLFLDLYERFGLRFIIETHSEYLIRRTQVLVAKMFSR